MKILKLLEVYKYYILGASLSLFSLGGYMYLGEREICIYKGGDKNEMLKISKELSKLGIYFRLEDSQIIVKEKDSRIAYMYMKEESEGYEMLDKQDIFTLPPSIQKVNINRALEREVSRAIEKIYGITSAKVFITQDDENIKSSVIVESISKNILSMDKVESIKQIVSYAVPKLLIKNVSVVDQYGNVLNASKNGFLSHMKNSYEREIVQKIEDIIGKVLGKKHVKAEVSVEFDSKRKDESKEIYDDDEKVIKSKEISYSPNGEKLSEILNYEISKSTENSSKEDSEISKISVSVLVDYKKVGEEYLPLDKKEIRLFKKLIEGAICFNKKRGDKINIVNLQFKKNESSNVLEETKENRDVYYIALIFIMSILILFNIFYRRKNNTSYKDDINEEFAKSLAKWIDEK